MNISPERMTDPEKKPTPRRVSEWVGKMNYKRWIQITDFISSNYPEIFRIEWLFGGRKYGWWLRYKKSKSFCGLIPEKNAFKIVMVFGAEERRKAESVISGMRSHVREDYENARTFFDGKWLHSKIDNENVIDDIEKLMKIKRKPKCELNTGIKKRNR
jgi:hypothetical protein